MNINPVREIIKAAHPHLLRFACGHEVIADLRLVEDEFFAAVNETQQGVITKRLSEDRLGSLGQLPSAARAFALAYLERNHGADLRDQIRALDVAAARFFLALPHLYSTRKRTSSGVFVILPRSCAALTVGRMVLRTLPDTFEYWEDIETEAMRLGPLEMFP